MLHQKTTHNAIAAMSRLAELYGDPATLASSRDIAESRNLPSPVVAKILTDLSRGGLVIASPGPGGGYRLAKAPHEISLREVVDLFEREASSACPYGPDWCGKQAPCPMHNSLVAMQQIVSDYLSNTTLAIFANRTAKRK
jgi:Rrf2 family iron-sulfur cluster assembly transcriptional regulator